MAQRLVDRVVARLADAAALYHRLILVVEPPGVGKTTALQEVHEQTAAPLINLNLELSLRMLDLTERQRALQLPRLLSEIVTETDKSVVLLDNIELLFDPELKQNPLRLLQGLSRNKTIVVSWSGSVERDCVIYATPDHLEYRRYPVHDLQVISPEACS